MHVVPLSEVLITVVLIVTIYHTTYLMQFILIRLLLCGIQAHCVIIM